jgi:ArsR family transcriptional regulator
MAIKKKERALYEARATVAKALAHPTRLIILDALEQQERCVYELTELVGADQSTVSKHLAILKNIGLVDDRKDGAMSIYRCTCPCLKGMFECVESVLKAKFAAQAELLKV